MSAPFILAAPIEGAPRRARSTGAVDNSQDFCHKSRAVAGDSGGVNPRSESHRSVKEWRAAVDEAAGLVGRSHDSC
ncbi:MAG: hypothetical protein HY232_14895 [Acidobacteria bacterium]|nr:hypothetical protein [Acidobacteriota bacterium]